jgi:electron transfer flavoprotein alpha subunit
VKVLLVAEYREGKLLDSCFELFAFANELKAESAMLVVGSEESCKKLRGKIYLADVSKYLEYNPDAHKKIVLKAMEKEKSDYVVFLHSSYGWDMAPRVATALKVAQISEITKVIDNKFEIGCLNSKMRRLINLKTAQSVLTIQAGAFTLKEDISPNPQIEKIDIDFGADKSGAMEPTATRPYINFTGYEPAEKKEVDLTKAEIIVSAGRGIGKKENLEVISNLAKALRAELGASRPVVDSGWLDHSRQVGATGQIVSPKLYVACGISGAIQHITGMKKSNFIVAINKDKDAPISEVADVMVVADLMQFANAFTAKLSAKVDT